MLLYNHDLALCRWAGERIGIADFGPARAIGVVRDYQIVAVAVFHCYRHPNIEISFVTSDPRWATPHNVRAIIRYPFLTLGCKRLTAITEATNHRTRHFLKRMGFIEEGVHPDTFENGDAVSYGLLRRDAARWIEDRVKVAGT